MVVNAAEMNSSSICCLAFLGVVPPGDLLLHPTGHHPYNSIAGDCTIWKNGLLCNALHLCAPKVQCRQNAGPCSPFRNTNVSHQNSSCRPLNRHHIACASIATSDSLFREPMPGEAITLPNPSAPKGEYLLDKGIFERVAELRTFIEDIEISRGKKSELRKLERELNKENCEIVELTDEESARLEEGKTTDESEEASDDVEEDPYIPINQKSLEPIKEHVYEENMFEEVMGKAISVYRQDRDHVSLQRLQDIASEMAPVVENLRKRRSEEIIVRLINCFINDEEDINDVLEELQQKKQLNKYLMQRFDELIKLSSQKFRISDKHPAISEQFLKALKDRVAAQAITSHRGTDVWVRILAECFRYDNCVDYETVLKKRLRKIEDIEEFHAWLEYGIKYCLENNRMQNKIDAMESIASIVVQMHPVWTPKDDHVETEDTPYDHPIIADDIVLDE